MKIIFLDFDGVVVCSPVERVALPNGKKVHALNGPAVERLNKIVEATNAEVVVTSTWRLHHSLERLTGYLERAGFKGRVRDTTPDIWPMDGNARVSEYRSEEIKQWLKSRLIRKWVVIDDVNIKGVPDKQMIHVYAGWENGGLQDSHVEKAIKVLNE